MTPTIKSSRLTEIRNLLADGPVALGRGSRTFERAPRHIVV
jgi:hypothetical protein